MDSLRTALRLARLSYAAYKANVDTAALSKIIGQSELSMWRQRPRTFRFPEYDTNGFFGIDGDGQGILVFSGTRKLSTGNLSADLDIDSVDLYETWENPDLHEKKARNESRPEAARRALKPSGLVVKGLRPAIEDSGDSNQEPPKVHEGFRGAWRCARDLVLTNFIEPYADLMPRGLVVCGHSLGGAIALLASNSIRHRISTEDLKEISVVTFGAPRVGNGAARRLIASRVPSITNVVNVRDAIPRLPLFEFCTNPGTTLFLSFDSWIALADATSSIAPFYSFSPLSALRSHKLKSGYEGLLQAFIAASRAPSPSWAEFLGASRKEKDQRNQQESQQGFSQRFVQGIKESCIIF